jgi:DNA repair protein SbcC/Rad50
MTPTELTARVSENFPDALRIDESIVQFIRRDGSRPFAICYLDCGEKIPKTSGDLQSYQDRVIGRRYFDGPKSLQWNNYLFFLASDDCLHSAEALRIRDLLEQDRTYARKFLIGESELGQILKPVVVAPEQATKPSVLSVWNTSLAEAGLGRAVWGDLDMPRRLALIEAAPTHRATVPQAASRVAKPSRSLSRFSLNSYRTYPLDRHFEFGTVNLIIGPNATGKTSLMEAIELFYCGRNKRSPADKPEYDLCATFDDGSTERVDHKRPIRTLRQRNLSWYGQAEVQTNNLYSSFARFNFLDTDAAVRLAEEATKIDEDLSKLLIGPDAAKTWDNILKVQEQSRLRLKTLRDEEKSLQRQIAEADALIATLTEGTSSELVRDRLLRMLRLQGWRAPEADGPENMAAQLIGPLSELVALARQAANLPLLSAPSRTVLERFARSTKASRDKISADIDYLVGLERQINLATTEIERANGASLILQRANRYVAAGIRRRYRAACQRRVRPVCRYDPLGIQEHQKLERRLAE